MLVVGFFLFLIVQVLILKNLVIFGIAFCFLYVLYILLLPLNMKTVQALLIAFVLGMGVDLFYDTMGVHTASLLLVAFVRKKWIQSITPTGGYDDDIQPTLLNLGIGWFLIYSLPLILIHHTLFFYIENIGTNLFFSIVQKVIASAVLLLIMSIIVQLLFYSKKRGI